MALDFCEEFFGHPEFVAHIPLPLFDDLLLIDTSVNFSRLITIISFSTAKVDKAETWRVHGAQRRRSSQRPRLHENVSGVKRVVNVSCTMKPSEERGALLSIDH